MADRECCIGRGLAALRSNTDGLLHEFLALWVKSQRTFLEAVSIGTTFQSINRKTLSSLEIPLPPIEAQQLLVPVMCAERLHLETANTHRLLGETLFKMLMAQPQVLAEMLGGSVPQN